MRSPCLECPRLGQDKKTDECRRCEKRWAYVEAMGGMTHSVPDEMTDMRRSARRETDRGIKMEQNTSVFIEGIPYTDKEMTATPETKTCRTCHKVKCIDDFARSAKSPDGYMHNCKACHGAKVSAGAARNSNKTTVSPVADHKPDPAVKLKEKRCRQCGLEKQISDFMPSVMSKDGYMHICIDCWKKKSDMAASTSGLVIKIDMSEHQDALESLQTQAHRDLRTVEMQALYIIRKACCANQAAKGI